MAWDFVVAKSDLRRTEFRDAAPAPLNDGEVRLAIESFALTANNITYAVFGEAMKYWDFFPGPDGFGRVPVWGHARVEASAHPDIAVGQRFYGYWPMSTHLTVLAKPGKTGFTDVAPHRQHLAVVYNQYQAVGEDDGLEAHKALLQPLFTTAFLIDDQFDEHGFYGAASVILSSASSKTAIGLAAQRDGAAGGGLDLEREEGVVPIGVEAEADLLPDGEAAGREDGGKGGDGVMRLRLAHAGAGQELAEGVAAADGQDALGLGRWFRCCGGGQGGREKGADREGEAGRRRHAVVLSGR